ncbi:MAG: CHASE4 domain-containing protein [Bdellovibrionota bacterium]
MRLRLKVLRWIVVTALISTGSLYFYVRSAVFQELGAIEAREEAARFDIVRRLLDSSTAAFQAWSYEYAIWDEMSAFLKGKNPGFLAKNFTKDEMNGIDVHAGAHVIVPKHVFVFARNKLVGYVGLDKGGTRITAPAPNWMSLALAVLERRNLRGWQETNTGYANADGRTYQYVLRIATNSGADAEEEGFLLVFREWGVDEVADLKGISGLSLEYVPVQAGAATHDSEHAVVVGDGIQSEKAYTDFLGSPVFSVRLTSPRTSFKMGSQALNLFLLMIFALSFATITAVVLAFDRLVLNRIARLHNTVQSAKDDRGAIEKLEQSNEDEISDLSGEMKRLFSQLVTLAENDFLTGIPNRRSFFEHASLLQKLMGDATWSCATGRPAR